MYPRRERILVAKGTIAPRAAYEPIAARIIEVNTPGATGTLSGSILPTSTCAVIYTALSKRSRDEFSRAWRIHMAAGS